MFCNAWISDPYKVRVMDVEKLDFQRVLNVNVLGVFDGECKTRDLSVLKFVSYCV
ncbi:putative secoisolariciresinol dehydrogenase [Helianthus anomalus]